MLLHIQTPWELTDEAASRDQLTPLKGSQGCLSPNRSDSVFPPQAQKPKNKRLSRLFEELKSSYDRQQRIHPLVEAGGEPVAKILKTRED